MFPTESPGNHRLEVTSGQPLHMGSLVTEDSVYRHTTPHCGCLLPALVSSRYLETTCPSDTTISGTCESEAAGV